MAPSSSSRTQGAPWLPSPVPPKACLLLHTHVLSPLSKFRVWKWASTSQFISAPELCMPAACLAPGGRARLQPGRESRETHYLPSPRSHPWLRVGRGPSAPLTRGLALQGAWVQAGGCAGAGGSAGAGRCVVKGSKKGCYRWQKKDEGKYGFIAP